MPDGHARSLVLLRAGAHLYGTATPASDFDAKSVLLPAARDILLQRVQATIVGHRVRGPGERVAASETDIETHTAFSDISTSWPPTSLLPSRCCSRRTPSCSPRPIRSGARSRRSALPC